MLKKLQVPVIAVLFLTSCSSQKLLPVLRAPSSSITDCSGLYAGKSHFADINNFKSWVDSEKFHLLEKGLDESHSFRRAGVILEGDFMPKVVKGIAHENQLVVSPTGKMTRYGGKDYIEFPNSTAMQVMDPVTQIEREFILTRGVRAYETHITLPAGSINPQGYVSDVLLFERIGDDYQYVHTILESRPERNFLFEDPRISFIIDKEGKYRYFLSGTDYSPHVKGSSSPDVMNRFFELKFDERGTPLARLINSKNKDKVFSNLSPFPTKIGGEDIFVDAKNATIYQNELGEVVVRTRMRPDFNSMAIKKLAGEQKWKYAEQVFIFENFDEFKKYDWNNSLYDLFSPSAASGANRVRPNVAKTILTDAKLREMYKSKNVMLDKGKGMGPGSIPVRVQRKGNEIFLSDAKGAKEHFIGEVNRHRSDFPLRDGEVKYITFDHEIRYFADEQNGSQFTKRHYSASVKLFDQRISKIEAYYADVIQPITKHERGLKSGIVDLQHVYPMGRTIVKDAETGKRVVRVYAGASDAHTTAYDFDVMKLLEEMSQGSARRKSGQVYLP